MVLKQDQMVVFDQNAVAQGIPMVGTATERHSPLLKPTPTGKCFSRVQDTDRVAAYRSTELLRDGGDSRKMLKKVQGDSLGL